MFTLVDVGAAGGIYERWKEYNVNPILFEPHPESYQFLIDLKVKSTGEPIYKDVRQIALSDTTGIVMFNLCRKPDVSSILEPDFKYSKQYSKSNRFDILERIEVETDTLDNQVKEPIDILKIDTQGYEYFILKGAELHLPPYKSN